jgi:hypothetical protein
VAVVYPQGVWYRRLTEQSVARIVDPDPPPHPAKLPDDLDEMVRAFMPSRTLLTALELDIFSTIREGASSQQVAETIHANARATEMLLNALVSLKLLEKRDGTFSATPTTRRFFSADSPDNARPGLIHIANLWHRWSTLTDCVRSGRSYETRSPGWVKDFITALDHTAKNAVARL